MIRVPDKFPKGTEFVHTFGGDWFVHIPEEGWFKLLDDGVTLAPRPAMPPGRKGAPGGGISITEDPAAMLADAASSRLREQSKKGVS